MHAGGGTIVPQLWHIGTVRQQGKLFPDAPVFGPSGLRPDGTEAEGGRAMTQADIDEVVEAFAKSAAEAERIGMDGVEIHGAHGYLIDQFLWERTNRRTDAYGGDLVARTKFAAEVVAAVRDSVSADFPIIFRYSQWKQEAYDARLAETPEELEALLSPLVAAGVDAFHASTRRYWQAEFEGSELNLAGWTKKLTGKPTITVGSVGLDGEFLAAFAGESSSTKAIDDLLDGLEAEEFDLVAVGRALLQDPEWAAKVLDGRFGELKAFSSGAGLAQLRWCRAHESGGPGMGGGSVGVVLQFFRVQGEAEGVGQLHRGSPGEWGDLLVAAVLRLAVHDDGLLVAIDEEVDGDVDCPIADGLVDAVSLIGVAVV